jgi:hypothetical protein
MMAFRFGLVLCVFVCLGAKCGSKRAPNDEILPTNPASGGNPERRPGPAQPPDPDAIPGPLADLAAPFPWWFDLIKLCKDSPREPAIREFVDGRRFERIRGRAVVVETDEMGDKLWLEVSIGAARIITQDLMEGHPNDYLDSVHSDACVEITGTIEGADLAGICSTHAEGQLRLHANVSMARVLSDIDCAARRTP